MTITKKRKSPPLFQIPVTQEQNDYILDIVEKQRRKKTDFGRMLVERIIKAHKAGETTISFV